MKKQAVQTENAPAAIGPYSQAVKAGGFVFVSGQIPLHPQTGELVSGIENQAAQSLENLRAILNAAGLEMEDVVKCSIFLTDMANFAAVNKIYERFFSAPFPARSCVAVSALPKGALVEIEAIAMVNGYAE